MTRPQPPDPPPTQRDHHAGPQPAPQPPLLRAVPDPVQPEARAHPRAKDTHLVNPDLNPGSQPLAITTGDDQAVPLAARLKTWAHPPDVRRELPPTWDQIRWHGSDGDHVARTGWPRNLAYGWSRAVVLPVRAVLIWLDWIIRAPSRTAVAFVLYALLAHLGPLTWLPWPGFLP